MKCIYVRNSRLAVGAVWGGGLFTWIIHRYTSCRIKTAIGRINSQHKQVEWGGKVNIADDQLISQSGANFTNHTFNVQASIVCAVEC